MSPSRHARLLFQALAVWGLFWLGGFPDYYRQYPDSGMAVFCVLLSVGISLGALLTLRKGPPGRRLRRAFWIAFYYTVPFAVLDGWYCGIHLGHGGAFLGRYWYLTVFYLTPWLTFLPTALVLNRPAAGKRPE
ncbi:MAG: hypothetical protein HY823_04720 [Acidobacteria bacterium]|nr:hypothetical protein [Acidobacteriota bacterium]